MVRSWSAKPSSPVRFRLPALNLNSMREFFKNLFPSSEHAFDITKFTQRLRETATWIEYVTPTNGSKLYRSLEIEPKDLLLEIIDSKYQEGIVNDVLNKRAIILLEKEIPLLELDDVLNKGYLLYSFVNETVTDGASEAESNCLFDVYDIPAWDTWIYWHELKGRQLLLAWIPLRLAPYAEQGIAVNCVECFTWAAHTPNELTSLLLKNGLIRSPKIDSTVELDLRDFHINAKLLEAINEDIRRKKK